MHAIMAFAGPLRHGSCAAGAGLRDPHQLQATLGCPGQTRSWLMPDIRLLRTPPARN